MGFTRDPGIVDDMKRIGLFLFVVLATHLGGCAHNGQFRQNAKQSALYVGVVASIIAVMVLSGCEHCTFQTLPETGARK